MGLLPRPNIKLPLWAAAAIPAAAWLLRSVARGFDFSVDGLDVLVFVLLGAAIAMTASARRSASVDEDEPHDEIADEDDSRAGQRQADEVHDSE